MISKRFFQNSGFTSKNKIFCKNPELIENYDKAIADTTQTWVCHHRLECIETGGVCNVTSQDLIDWGIYYDRPPEEFIFLTNKEHRQLHNRNPWWSFNKPKDFSEKVSKYQKGRPKSEEHRKHLSEACKGRKGPTISEDGKRRISESKLGVPRDEETKRKLSEKIKGRKFFTNGIVNVQQFECPEGFWPGLTRKKKAGRLA